MSLAEDMLATMSVSDDSVSYLAEEEPHIVINESRQAIVPNELKTIAVTGDKDIETITFDCVRYWDGNDLSTFAIYLNYVLPDLTTGTYIPEKITTTDGDEFYHFDWQIKNNITVKSGKISFAVTAISTTTNWAGNPIVDKQWSSLPNSDCYIALGIDVSNVPSEEESSAVLAQMSAILEQIQTDFDDWLKNSVVQTTGDSTTAVMSQRATTEELDLLKTRLKLYDDAYEIIVTGLENTYYIAMRNSKQIDNLKSGISDQFETDSSVAYVKDVPPNALPYAEVKKIGGMTYKSKNLTDIADTTTTESGYIFKRLALPKSIQSGTYTLSFRAKNYTPNNQFQFSFFNAGGEKIADSSGVFLQETCIFTFTLNDEAVFVELYVNSSNGGTFYNFMLNPGDTALPYEPYFEGLRSAKVTEVKSVGVNLAQPFKIDTNNIFVQKTPFFEVKPNTDYYVSAKYNSILGIGANFFVVRKDGSPLYNQVFANDIAVCINSGDNTQLYLQVNNGDDAIASDETLNWLNNSIMLNKGSTALPYTPYVEHTLPIPEAVQALDGYGLGVSDTIYNYIDWEKMQFVKQVRCVDLGTLSWTKSAVPSRYDIFYTDSLDDRKHHDRSYFLCSKYSNATPYVSMPDKTITGDSLVQINIKDSDYIDADAATFKTAMSGVMFVYALEEPEVTDISDLITADNLIGVEGGGTLTFENEYGYAVPSEVEYQVEV